MPVWGSYSQDAGLFSEIRERVATSAGADCHSEGDEISHVLRAMKILPLRARGSLRFSTGRITTQHKIERAVNTISHAVIRIRKEV